MRAAFIFTAVSRGTDSSYQSFTMNNIGDIQSVTDDGTTTNRTTNADNQIINIAAATVSYDSDGNVTTDDKGDTLVYDAWNRLVEVKNSSGDLIAGYTYDGLGRMTSRPMASPRLIFITADSRSSRNAPRPRRRGFHRQQRHGH